MKVFFQSKQSPAPTQGIAMSKSTPSIPENVTVSSIAAPFPLTVNCDTLWEFVEGQEIATVNDVVPNGSKVEFYFMGDIPVADALAFITAALEVA